MIGSAYARPTITIKQTEKKVIGDESSGEHDSIEKNVYTDGVMLLTSNVGKHLCRQQITLCNKKLAIKSGDGKAGQSSVRTFFPASYRPKICYK
uniref:Uncharacterized protein n=1 Tax=Romanomermis culicivorax TaxID=13658 RepID=A0A915JT57_ROMCU